MKRYAEHFFLIFVLVGSAAPLSSLADPPPQPFNNADARYYTITCAKHIERFAGRERQDTALLVVNADAEEPALGIAPGALAGGQLGLPGFDLTALVAGAQISTPTVILKSDHATLRRAGARFDLFFRKVFGPNYHWAYLPDPSSPLKEVSNPVLAVLRANGAIVPEEALEMLTETRSQNDTNNRVLDRKIEVLAESLREETGQSHQQEAVVTVANAIAEIQGRSAMGSVGEYFRHVNELILRGLVDFLWTQYYSMKVLDRHTSLLINLMDLILDDFIDVSDFTSPVNKAVREVFVRCIDNFTEPLSVESRITLKELGAALEDNYEFPDRGPVQFDADEDESSLTAFRDRATTAGVVSVLRAIERQVAQGHMIQNDQHYQRFARLSDRFATNLKKTRPWEIKLEERRQSFALTYLPGYTAYQFLSELFQPNGKLHVERGNPLWETFVPPLGDIPELRIPLVAIVLNQGYWDDPKTGRCVYLKTDERNPHTLLLGNGIGGDMDYDPNLLYQILFRRFYEEEFQGVAMRYALQYEFDSLNARIKQRKRANVEKQLNAAAQEVLDNPAVSKVADRFHVGGLVKLVKAQLAEKTPPEAKKTDPSKRPGLFRLLDGDFAEFFTPPQFHLPWVQDTAIQRIWPEFTATPLPPPAAGATPTDRPKLSSGEITGRLSVFLHYLDEAAEYLAHVENGTLPDASVGPDGKKESTIRVAQKDTRLPSRVYKSVPKREDVLGAVGDLLQAMTNYFVRIDGLGADGKRLPPDAARNLLAELDASATVAHHIFYTSPTLARLVFFAKYLPLKRVQLGILVQAVNVLIRSSEEVNLALKQDEPPPWTVAYVGNQLSKNTGGIGKAAAIIVLTLGSTWGVEHWFMKPTPVPSLSGDQITDVLSKPTAERTKALEQMLRTIQQKGDESKKAAEKEEPKKEEPKKEDTP